MQKLTTEFKSTFAENVFQQKYARYKGQTWAQKAKEIVEDVCGRGVHRQHAHPLMGEGDRKQLEQYIREFKFLPGGRYIYYAGRSAAFWNNCYLLRAEEDSREEWANIAWRATSCLMVGGGIGVDYSVIRPKGRMLSRTGGMSSGPVPLIEMVNEIGRRVMQGGSRRSAIYASMNWRHDDILQFMTSKNWADMPVGNSGLSMADLKRHDFNFATPLDMTNISLNYDNAWRDLGSEQRRVHPIFLQNVEQALRTGEPGFSFNFDDQENETLRNACTEITSEDDSDVCNLGSVNFGAIESIKELEDVVALASKFLVCGTLRAELPFKKVYEVRERNRRLGLGIMGLHEWLLKRDHPYGCPNELREWLDVYEVESENAANEHCDRFYLSRPKGYRAIAPTGTIGILAGTTTGIEPLFAVAYRRRYLTEGTRWKYEYVVDSTAQLLIEKYGLDHTKIETAGDLAKDPERRISAQAAIQKYVDHAISSTLNLPAWGSEYNNPDKVKDFAAILSKYAPKLRGMTTYPDGSRGGQPITPVPYDEAVKHKGAVYEDNSEMSCKEGVCGL
jgi:ribonucleoside-diphosphate reductase alpha chain